MPSTEIEPGDRLAPFTLQALAAHHRFERPSAFELHTRWEIAGYRGWDIQTTLRSGLSLGASSCRWERPGSIVVDHTVSDLTFLVSRGPGMRVSDERGAAHLAGGGTSQVWQVRKPVRMRYDAAEGAHDEVVCLDVSAERLKELLGARELPGSIAAALAGDSAYPVSSFAMTPALFRALDEILYCDAVGPSRQLHLEGKGLELLALLIDHFEAAARDDSPRLSPSDIDRLQVARQLLLACLASPPSLPELARLARLNEAKLKAGFRALFGSSVFGYLRRQRMEEARRLLLTRNHNVTEVAARVGYANPSKFAAAYRKQFGVSPSAVV
jgi:AraC-like DNA-binding protein